MIFIAITLTKLVIGVLIAGAILTAGTYFLMHKKQSVLLSFLQHSAGALFLFSGFVKAVDPLGTAFKMEQYFAEFESTFSETWLNFIAPLFPFFSEYSAAFSVFMIVLEIVLGVMLIVGYRRRLTAWLFFAIVAFFTVLTGFTFLTGYVPRDANFFDFSSWGPYTKSNMRVTDCGCFGDFLKLDPKVSFFKDIVLLVPSIIFVLYHNKKHQLFTKTTRGIIVGATGLITLWYCLSNFVWDLPKTDFRPFKEGVNIRDTKEAEEEAMALVDILGWEMQNDKTGQVVKVMNPSYSAVLKEYPKDQGWTLKDQVKSEPKMPSTKISEFDVVDSEGYSVTDAILDNPKPTFWIINYKLPYDVEKEMITVKDTTITIDPETFEETMTTETRERQVKKYLWKEPFQSAYTDKVNGLAKAAAQDGVQTISIVKETGADVMESLGALAGGQMTVYKADDILLKTIIRSNPGVLLLQDGKILEKYHIDQLPTYDEIKTKHKI